MKLIDYKTKSNGRLQIYFCGIKIASIKTRKKCIKSHSQEFVNFEQFDGKSAEIDDLTLSKIYKSQNKYLSMKWEQYFGIYERHLAPYIRENKPLKLLEIGVQNGGSLETWKDYLPKGSKIIGIDINPLCNSLEFSENIQFLLGSASDKEFINKNLAGQEFDIIIDDGSHISDDVKTSFELLFPKLKMGGIYIVEDCHTSYWKSYNGGFRNPQAYMEYFKNLADSINFRYIKEYEKNSIQEIQQLEKLNKQIASISFYDSVIIIEKYLNIRHKPFRNYMTKGEALVVSRKTGSSVAITCDENTVFEKIYKN